MSDVDWGNYAEAYKTIHEKLDEILTKLDYPTDPAVQDVIDRADRLLGRVYGSEGVALLQRGTTHELKVQLCHEGTEYQAGGGAGGAGGLVQCQIRNAANDAWINEPFARRVQGSQAQDLLQRATTYDLIVQLRNAGVEVDPRDRNWTITESLNRAWNLGSGDVPDLMDRAGRLLGIVYGDVGQLLQRPTTKDLLIQLRHAGAEIDPRNIRALTSSDVMDVSDRAARDLGKVDIAGFDVSLPAGTNVLGTVTAQQDTPANLKATVTPSGDMARKEYYDRGGTVLQYGEVEQGAGSGSTLFEYTVPSGKKAFHQILYQCVEKAVVTSGRMVQVIHYCDVGAGYKMFAKTRTDYGDGLCSTCHKPYTVAVPFVLNAGHKIKCTVYNSDTITHSAAGASLLVEFDA